MSGLAAGAGSAALLRGGDGPELVTACVFRAGRTAGRQSVHGTDGDERLTEAKWGRDSPPSKLETTHTFIHRRGKLGAAAGQRIVTPTDSRCQAFSAGARKFISPQGVPGPRRDPVMACDREHVGDALFLQPSAQRPVAPIDLMDVCAIREKPSPCSSTSPPVPRDLIAHPD
jgi:hypothetical protein